MSMFCDNNTSGYSSFNNIIVTPQVQLPERVVVYEQGDVEGMLYRVREKLPQKTECSLLVATSDALLLCQVWYEKKSIPILFIESIAIIRSYN